MLAKIIIDVFLILVKLQCPRINKECFLTVRIAVKFFEGVSHAQETVSKNFLAFPTLRKPSQKIFWRFPHSGNRINTSHSIENKSETAQIALRLVI